MKRDDDIILLCTVGIIAFTLVVSSLHALIHG